MLGNDIVDLELAPEKLYDERFLDRVFSAREMSLIYSEEALWTAFAAKEAMFKAVKGAHPERPVPFREIEVGENRVVFRELEASLRIGRGEGYVHCLAWTEREPLVRIECVPEEEASLLLRDWAIRRLVDRGFPDCEIRKDGPERFRPPRIYSRGDLVPGAKLSFSHDGRFAALAMAT